MSEQAWTKEPWGMDSRAMMPCGIRSGGVPLFDAIAVGDSSGNYDRRQTEANIDRAVACVNALAGLKPEGVAAAVETLIHVVNYGSEQLCVGANAKVGGSAYTGRDLARKALEALGVSDA